MQRRFTPVNWSTTSNMYEVNVRQYTREGTFNAFSKHLPRLRDMGIETLWFMPVTPISQEKRQGALGSYYACSDYKAINPEFGAMADFKALIKEAHSMGFKVIIDWVANHTGYDHIWVKTHPEYYKKNAEGNFYDTNNWHDVIDLNYYDHGLRAAMIDAMSFWVRECDIDGFRCDMCHLVPLDFWQKARATLDAIKPLFWLGETQDVAYLSVFDCMYGWRWMSATEKFARHEAGLQQLYDVLTHYEFDCPPGTFPLLFTSNHDENTWNGTEFEKYGSLSKPLAVFNCTWNCMPLIYTGQELPLHKRLPFFDKDHVEWRDKPELHTFYKTLLELRKQHPALQIGVKPTLIPIESNIPVMAFHRQQGDREVLVILNFSGNDATIQVPVKGHFTNLFTRLPLAAPASLAITGYQYFVLVK
jgi:Glycosidases